MPLMDKNCELLDLFRSEHKFNSYGIFRVKSSNIDYYLVHVCLYSGIKLPTDYASLSLLTLEKKRRIPLFCSDQHCFHILTLSTIIWPFFSQVGYHWFLAFQKSFFAVALLSTHGFPYLPSVNHPFVPPVRIISKRNHALLVDNVPTATLRMR